MPNLFIEEKKLEKISLFFTFIRELGKCLETKNEDVFEYLLIILK